MALEIDVVNEGTWRVVRVCGEVDLNSSPELREAVLEAVDEHGRVGIDLSAAAYMDSSGVATMVEALKAAAEKDGTFVLVRPSPAVRKVLSLSRLDMLFDIREELTTG